MGRPPWSQPGTQGGGQTVAVNNRPQITRVAASVKSGSVASGSNEVVEVYAPTGSVYEVLTARLKVTADADATTGEHGLKFVAGDGGVWATYATTNYNEPLEFDRSVWVSATNKIEPSNQAAQALSVQNVRADEAQPFQIIYENNTDAAQENARKYNIMIEEVSY